MTKAEIVQELLENGSVTAEQAVVLLTPDFPLYTQPYHNPPTIEPNLPPNYPNNPNSPWFVTNCNHTGGLNDNFTTK